MKQFYTQKAVKECIKNKRPEDLIRLWELEKEKNPVYLNRDALKELTYCQKETLKEQIKRGLRLGLSDEHIELIKDFFCLRNNLSDYQETCEYPF